MFGPKHTLKSVMTELEAGLRAGTIKLRDGDREAAAAPGPPKLDLMIQTHSDQDHGEPLLKLDLATELAGAYRTGHIVDVFLSHVPAGPKAVDEFKSSLSRSQAQRDLRVERRRFPGPTESEYDVVVLTTHKAIHTFANSLTRFVHTYSTGEVVLRTEEYKVALRIDHHVDSERLTNMLAALK